MLHTSQVVPATLSGFDVTAVLGSILPLAAILSAAVLLGWLVHQPVVVALVGTAFAVAPNMSLNVAGQTWLQWVPGTYLPFGLWLTYGQGLAFSLPGATPTGGLGLSAGWILACAAVVGWHACL